MDAEIIPIRYIGVEDSENARSTEERHVVVDLGMDWRAEGGYAVIHSYPT